MRVTVERPEVAPDPRDRPDTERARQAPAWVPPHGELLELVEHAVEGVHWIDPDGTILRANRTELERLGYPESEYVGRPAADFHADPAGIAEVLEKLRAGEDPPAREARLRCRDGSVRHAHLEWRGTREEGRLVRVRCTTRDVTEQRAMEVLLAGEARMLEMMTQQVPLGDLLELLCRTVEDMATDHRTATILLMDPQGTLRHAAGVRCPTAYTSALDRVPVGPAHGSCGTAAHRLEPVIAADIATDPLWAPHAELRDLALSHGLRACWSVPILSPDRQVLGTFAVYHEDPRRPSDAEVRLSELLAHGAGVAIDLYRGREALHAADRNKDAFLITVAHELRNCLGPASTAIHLLQQVGPPDPRLQRSRDVIDRQVHLMARIVDDLTDMSRIRRGQLVLRRERVELESLVRRAVDVARPLIDERRHHLSVSLPHEPVPLNADPARLVQVLGNLLSNAAKYTPPGGYIWIEAQGEADRVEVRVRDTGVGMTPDLVDRAFEMFVRGDRGQEMASGGLGVGLSLVRDLVAMHEGTVSVSSAGPDRGSEFVVRLPPAPPATGDAMAPGGRPA
jgi:PAS domain S-box-containing protein